jgi:hypothetical protein
MAEKPDPKMSRGRETSSRGQKCVIQNSEKQGSLRNGLRGAVVHTGILHDEKQHRETSRKPLASRHNFDGGMTMSWRETRQNQPQSDSMTNAERQKKFRDKRKAEKAEAAKADKPDPAKVKRMQDALNDMIPKSMRAKPTKTDMHVDYQERMQQTLSALKTAFDDLMTAPTMVDRTRLIGSIVALDNLLEADAARAAQT